MSAGEARFRSAELAATLKPTKKEKRALWKALTYYHVNHFGGVVGIRKIATMPTPDDMINSVLPGDYQKDRDAMKRYHALTNLMIAMAEETVEVLKGAEVVNEVERLNKQFDKDTTWQREDRDAILEAEGDIIADAKKRMASAKEAYFEAVTPSREFLEEKVLMLAGEALKESVKEALQP